MDNKITTNKLTTNLWFNNEAEEAVKFYCSVFKNSKTGNIHHYGKAGYEIHGMREGTVMTIEFEIEGQSFLALNAGPIFKFNESISFIVNCETQEEIDYYWEKLSEGGDKNAQVCGWLKDKFGVSWQVAPALLSQLREDGEYREKADRVMTAILQMKKLDIKTIQEAYEK